MRFMCPAVRAEADFNSAGTHGFGNLNGAGDFGQGVGEEGQADGGRLRHGLFMQ